MTSLAVPIDVDIRDERAGGEREELVMRRRGLTIAELERIADGASIRISAEVLQRVVAARTVIERALQGDDLVYGLNTHLGHRRNERIENDSLEAYQHFVLDTHAGAIGKPLPQADVRSIMAARIAGMSQGGSGVSPAVFTTLVAMLNAGVHPVVPRIGSVGAADLTLLAAIADVVRGQGRAIYKGEELPGAVALYEAGLRPARLLPKDALALVSANSATMGVAALELRRLVHLADVGDFVGALTSEAVDANLSPFTAAAAEAKGLEGIATSAANLRILLHADGRRSNGNVQDPVSIRTLPQVHGALRAQIATAIHAIEAELNAPADNPVVVLEEQKLISNGNFSALHVTLALESLRVAIAHVASISERRLHKLLAVRHPLQVDGATTMRGRVPNLVVNASASLLADVRHIANPVSLHASPLNCDVEDHASLAMNAVMVLRESLHMLEEIFAIEALLAADTIVLTGKHDRLGPQLSAVQAGLDIALDGIPERGLSAALAVTSTQLRAVTSVGGIQ